MNWTKSDLKDLTYQINGAAIQVHKELGPGLLESTYHNCLKVELASRNLGFQSQLVVPILYKDVNVDAHLRCDLLIEQSIAVELKSVENISPLYEAQILTYMKLLEVPKGILFNFNVENLYGEGQKTFVNEIFRKLKD